MRIGIDCRTILSPDTGEKAGTAHYTYELVRHLLALDHDNTYVLFFDARVKTVGYDGRKLQDSFCGANVEMIFLSVSRMPMATTHVFFFRALVRANLDLFHSPAHPLPLFYRGKSIWTVHDLAIYYHPEWFPGGARRWFSTRVTVPRSIRRAEKLIAVSENTKKDILRFFGVPETKITVIYEGAPTKIRNPKSEIRNPKQIQNSKFFLFIGTIEPRKNLVRLIDAFIKFRQNNVQRTMYNLMLAGGNGWNNEDVFMAIDRANMKLGKGSVQYLGYVSEEEKFGLLQNATAFVWLSLYEGFGLPLLEAMAMGVPVITSTASSIPEIVGDAALLVDPESVSAIAFAMERITMDIQLCQQLKMRGMDHAKQFSWEKTARETLSIYRAYDD